MTIFLKIGGFDFEEAVEGLFIKAFANPDSGFFAHADLVEEDLKIRKQTHSERYSAAENCISPAT